MRTGFGFTWCGHRLRYWSFGPDAYHSSRLIDLKKDNHLSDFVDLVIFLLGPVERILPRWQPNFELFVVRPGTKDPSRTGQWRPKDGQSGIVSLRAEPTGSRTVGWQGSFTESTGKPLDIVIKASWLSEDLALHEYRILDSLLNDNARLHFQWWVQEAST